MKHTHTPWKADGTDICQNNNKHFHVIANVKRFKDYDADDIRNKQSAPDKHQYLVEINVPIDGDERANAEHMVRCVNSHDELLEAAKGIITMIEFGYENQVLVKMLEKLKKAIAKAEGK